MKQGDIYFIQWDPSIGHEFKKTRPAIILSSDETIKESNLITVMAITKNGNSPITDDIEIKKNDDNRLMYDSLIKVHHISSFDKSRCKKYIGKIDEKKLKEIRQYLHKHFAL